MGTVTIVADTLFGQTRSALLSVIYGHVGESFYLRQLSRLTEIAIGPVQRELRQLVDANLVTKTVNGAHILYSANQASPVFLEIKNLVTKTVGMHDVLRDALIPIRDNIAVAFVYGSVARSRERKNSDVDLMVVGEVEFSTVVERLSGAEEVLNREVNPTVYSVSEFREKLKLNFLRAVLAEPKLFIIGDENVVRDLGQ
jgi:uncharacterized protein